MSSASDQKAPRKRAAQTLRTLSEPGDRARLVVLAGPQIGRRFTITDDVEIGRSSSSAIVLDDAEVSRRHARIKRLTNTLTIEDLDSRNGTFVNDVPIQRAALSYGDRIRLGTSTVLLLSRYGPDEQSILQRQRLEALGRLGAGIAHDLNNMLGVIVATLDYIDDLPPDEAAEQAGCLDEIRMAAERASELTPRLLSFARTDAHGHGRVDLSDLCEEVAQLVRRTFDRSVRVNTKLSSRLVVMGDAVELHQTLMNLCLNARDAMPDGGTLTIEAKPEGAQAVVTVRDSGVGIETDLQDRIFEPFFTTKQEQQGAGLGLASVREVLTYHGGTIDVESAPGMGTTFHLRLPKLNEPRIGRDTSGPRRTPRVELDHKPLILLVDDEDAMVRSLRRVLERAGHEVVAAGDGERALSLYASMNPRPDLVLLDLNLPEVRGEDTLRLLRDLDPEVRVVAISGYADQALRSEICAAGAMELLRKPCTSDLLLSTIAESLRMPPPPVEDLATMRSSPSLPAGGAKSRPKR